VIGDLLLVIGYLLLVIFGLTLPHYLLVIC